jgi:hypothetical protein
MGFFFFLTLGKQCILHQCTKKDTVYFYLVGLLQIFLKDQLHFNPVVKTRAKFVSF